MRESVRQELERAAPELLIFDKGGTLIDIHSMWSTWVRELAHRLSVAVDQPVGEGLIHAMGLDSSYDRVMPDGWLATTTMEELRGLTVGLMYEAGLSQQEAETAVADAWHRPDPVALARPLADLHRLFGTLRDRGARVAVATMDDRAPTEATLVDLKLDGLVDALVCGDDGVAPKPAADMVLALCDEVGKGPASAVVVGDSVADMEMGKRSGVLLTVGVLSGVTPREILAQHADMLAASVADLV